MLTSIGIVNVDDMLKHGATIEKRKKLCKKTSIPESDLLEFVQLSDITRVGYVKTKLARLYYNAGITSPQVLASYSPEELQAHFTQYVNKSGWVGQIPFLKDLTHNINNAKKVSEIVET
jgi:hypothetical protein